MSNAIADIVDLRAAVAERKLIALRNQQADHLQAIHRIEKACDQHEKSMRLLCLPAACSTTVRRLREQLQECRDAERSLVSMRELHSIVSTELEQVKKNRHSQRNLLVGIRHKAHYLRDRHKAEKRKASRRRTTRELLGD